MERIPSKSTINITFEIANCYQETTGPEMVSQIEGSFKITKQEEVIFSESDILLLELAISLQRWLTSDSKDFYYSSMDYEEEPILEIVNTGELSILKSVWFEESGFEVNIDDFKREVENFIKDFQERIPVSSKYLKL